MCPFHRYVLPTDGKVEVKETSHLCKIVQPSPSSRALIHKIMGKPTSTLETLKAVNAI